MRIKSFKLLPETADEDVAWAVDQCVTRQSLTQVHAFEGLKARLVVKGIAPPAFSSFNRFVAEMRESGVPPRYRVRRTDAGDPVESLIALLEKRLLGHIEARLSVLIDERIALSKHGKV